MGVSNFQFVLQNRFQTSLKLKPVFYLFISNTFWLGKPIKPPGVVWKVSGNVTLTKKMADAADVQNIIDVLLQCGECIDLFEQVEMCRGHSCL
jgi:hypothetical protein